MITHIVFIKLKDRVEQSEKVKNLLLGMKGQIDCLRHIEVGVDVLHKENSYDIALVTKFDSIEDMKEYLVHPAHVEVAKYIGTVKESSVVVDYNS